MIGDRIKARREELGLTQQQLADRLGYKSKSSINKIEVGLTDVSQSRVVDFANALDTSIEYLMDMGEQYHETGTEEDTDDSDINALIEAARDSDPDNVRMVTEILRKIKGANT